MEQATPHVSANSESAAAFSASVQREGWFIPFKQLEIEPERLGFGSFGAVHRGKWLESDVVIKRVNITTEADQRTFRREAAIWYRASHRHVARFFGASLGGNGRCEYLLVSEHAAGGTLSDFLIRQRGQGKAQAWRRVYEVALGVYFLHQNDIVHGDIKGNNVVISSEGAAMLIDFGLSFIVSTNSRPELGRVGAVRWKAPECLDGEGSDPTHASDVFALGMLIIEAVTGSPPWGQLLDAAVKHHVRNGRLPNRPSVMSDDQWTLVQLMCAFDPSERLGMDCVIPILEAFAAAEEEQELLQQVAETAQVVVTEDQAQIPEAAVVTPAKDQESQFCAAAMTNSLDLVELGVAAAIVVVPIAGVAWLATRRRNKSLAILERTRRPSDQGLRHH